MKETFEFACTDDSPFNNGWIYNSRWGDEDEDIEEDEDDIEWDGDKI